MCWRGVREAEDQSSLYLFPGERRRYCTRWTMFDLERGAVVKNLDYMLRERDTLEILFFEIEIREG